VRNVRLARAPLFLFAIGCALGAFSLTFTHLAGSFGGPGFEDGTATNARFNSDAAIAVDASGNIYVADSGNHTIRVISPTGEVTTLAGIAETSGITDGRGAHALFNAPGGIHFANSGAIYVADTGNHTIRKISSGVASTLVGYPGFPGFVNNTGAAARFRNPRGIATDGSGNLYVADTGNHSIRMITSGGAVTTLAGTGAFGNANGTGTAASFNSPNGIVYESTSNALYVADAGNGVVRRITLPGAVVTTFAGTMSTPGHADGVPGLFYAPSGITVDSAGTFYVSDAIDHTIRSITSGGTVATTAGLILYPGPDDGPLPFGARFRSPSGIAASGTTTLFVADTGNHTVRKLALGGNSSTFAGLANASGGIANATGSAARFNSPSGMASYPGPTPGSTYIYVSDAGNHAIRRVFGDGVVEFVAGGSFGYTNGTGATAQFRNPEGMALRFSDLSVFVADRDNHCIRNVTYAGVVTLYAGQATVPGSANGDRLTTAGFNSPRAIALNAAGTALYVADTGNFLIRKITLGTGAVTTLAGSGSFGSTNANGTSASFGVMTGISVDSFENVYVAESLTGTIRKIETDGDVTTLAGAPACCSGPVDGIGTAARFGYPGPTSIAGAFVADPQAHLMRTIDVSTAAVGTAGGKANVKGTSDGTGEFARFNAAARIATVGINKIVIAEGHTIRYGGPEIADRAVIDSAAGLVGTARQLDTSPQTATSWEWTIIRRPTGSTATLSSTTIRNPTFTPDAPDMYVFRCKATSASGSSISTVILNGNDPATAFSVDVSTLVTAGDEFVLSVTARDPWGNIADGYTGTAHFTSSDATATLPSDYTFLPGDHGAHDINVTLRESGLQSVTATDTVNGSINGAETMFVTPAVASELTVSITSPVGSGTPVNVTVTAKDEFDNVATGYVGTVHFTSSDGAATLPSNYTFLFAEEGIHTFPLGVTLQTAGLQSVTATDTVEGAITGTVNVTVGPSTPTSFSANRSGANVFLAWNPSSGADHYHVYRASPTSSGYAFLVQTSDTTYLDATVSANTVYAYKVLARDASTNPSPFSTPDAGTTIAFTDETLVSGTTAIKVAHMNELRTAVNSIRACALLSPISFTDTPVTTSILIRKTHIDELRTGLTTARTALGLPALAFTDPTLVVGSTSVKRLHVTDVRTGVK
jgi:sugar lactone lactonase YvrE